CKPPVTRSRPWRGRASAVGVGRRREMRRPTVGLGQVSVLRARLAEAAAGCMKKRIGTIVDMLIAAMSHHPVLNAAGEVPASPILAIRTGTATAIPVGLIRLPTAEPVANAWGGSDPAATPIRVGTVRPTPPPISRSPPSVHPT